MFIPEIGMISVSLIKLIAIGGDDQAKPVVRVDGKKDQAHGEASLEKREFIKGSQ